MKINWKVRVSNPTFWAHITVALVTPVFTHFSINWSQITTWAAFFSLLGQALQNPVVVVAMLVSAWNCIVDPTTKGVGDSSQVLACTSCATSKVDAVPSAIQANKEDTSL